MPNSYFQFKQFIVHQEKTAMKVCTDACLFGAWAADEIASRKAKIESILDIGAGTGLLSLMLAQATEAYIDAVEVDDAAAQQAKENFAASRWKERLKIHHTTIQQFNNELIQQYSIIVSNPPFFKNSLKSDNKQKNLARHTPSLTFEELADVVSALLKDEGSFYLLLPYYEFQSFVSTASEHNLFVHQKVNVQQTPKHEFFRTMGRFSKKQTVTVETKAITIKELNNEYSHDFVVLMKDYYLHL